MRKSRTAGRIVAAVLLIGLVFTVTGNPRVASQDASAVAVKSQHVMKGLCFSPFLRQDPSHPTMLLRQAATDSIGVTDPAKTWYLAEGSTGSNQDGAFETWVLVQNPGNKAADVTLNYMTPTAVVKGPSLHVAPLSRQSINVADTVPGQFSVSTVVTSDQPVIAERSMYWDAGLTEARIAALLDTVSPYSDWVRTFSSTGVCAGIPALAKAKGLKVAAGCDLSSDPAYNEAEVNGLVALARSGKIDMAVVGEESLYFNFVSEPQLLDYIRRLKATGVPTTTSDTWGELLGHPAVMSECDVILANMYPYWENVDISQAVAHVDWSYQQVVKGAPGKEVIIDTGWPTAGDQKGAAVPSQANANYFLANFIAWANARQVPYFYFEAFDEPWKAKHEGPVGSHWGIWDNNGQMKPGVQGILGNPR